MKVEGVVPVITGFLCESASAIVLPDELAKNSVECCQVLKRNP